MSATNQPPSEPCEVVRVSGVDFHVNRPNNEAWAQVGGDLHAADYGATFARIDLWRSPEQRESNVLLVQVELLPEGEGGEQPYVVSEFEFDAQHHDLDGTWGDRVASAIEDVGIRAWRAMDFLQRSLALFECGLSDPRQPDTFFDDHGDRFETLRAIMDSYGIPQCALLDLSQYTVVPD